VLIVGNPRSGTTLLRAHLERSPTLWRLGRESRSLWDDFTHPLNPGGEALPDAQLDPDRLDDLNSFRVELTDRYLRACFRPDPGCPDDEGRVVERLAAQGVNPWYYEVPRPQLEERFGSPPSGPPFPHETAETPPFTPLGFAGRSGEAERPDDVRLLDKDTGHVYRMPLLRQLFPDARFLFVVRDAPPTISSLIEAWRHPRWFFSYRMPIELRIRGYSDRYPWGARWWNLNLPPDWPELVDRPLEEVCARVWASGNEQILAHLPDLDGRRQALLVRYEELCADPAGMMERVADFIGLPHEEIAVEPGFRPPPVVTEVPPYADKWHKNDALVRPVTDFFASVQARLGYPTGVETAEPESKRARQPT
jgi:hypothetical protein